MKVKIKKEGKKETYNLIDSWSDVTLEKWMQLVNSKTDSKAKEAEVTIEALSDIPKELINQLDLSDVSIIMSALGEMQGKKEAQLDKVFEIDGVEYAMHPNLDNLTLGEYADLETFIKNGVENHLPEVMAVLFRPIKERKGKTYIIAAYDGEITLRAEEMKKMSAEQVQSALVFFYHFATAFMKAMPSFLQERSKEMKKQLQTETLQNAGDGTE